jgi:predicted ABC-type ATPase
LPIITIIAGPNGAGKSTHSGSISAVRGIVAFDFDKEFDMAWRRYGYDPSVKEGVWDSCELSFLRQKEQALFHKLNFAYETNYHSVQVIETVKEFKLNGFTAELVFIALSSVEHAVTRVKDRVSKKGHSVDLETIHEQLQRRATISR